MIEENVDLWFGTHRLYQFEANHKANFWTTSTSHLVKRMHAVSRQQGDRAIIYRLPRRR